MWQLQLFHPKYCRGKLLKDSLQFAGSILQLSKNKTRLPDYLRSGDVDSFTIRSIGHLSCESAAGSALEAAVLCLLDRIIDSAERTSAEDMIPHGHVALITHAPRDWEGQKASRKPWILSIMLQKMHAQQQRYRSPNYLAHIAEGVHSTTNHDIGDMVYMLTCQKRWWFHHVLQTNMSCVVCLGIWKIG